MASSRFDCPFTGDSFKGGLLERLRSAGASDKISIHCNRPVADGEDDCTIEDLIGQLPQLCLPLPPDRATPGRHRNRHRTQLTRATVPLSTDAVA